MRRFEIHIMACFLQKQGYGKALRIYSYACTIFIYTQILVLYTHLKIIVIFTLAPSSTHTSTHIQCNLNSCFGYTVVVVAVVVYVSNLQPITF